MRSQHVCACVMGAVVILSGCTSVQNAFVRDASPEAPGRIQLAKQAPENSEADDQGSRETHRAHEAETVTVAWDDAEADTSHVRTVSQEELLPETAERPIGPVDAAASEHVEVSQIPMNLPSALAMVSGQHPVVGMARWKVQEAYARLDEAEVLWLPSIRTGFSFHRHDGNYQASNGDIVDVHRSSFQYGFGAGATGAGTTPVPGIQAQFHLADAIFLPDVAQKSAWADCHAEKAIVNRQMRDVALAYLQLLNAHQQLSVLEELRQRTEGLAKITSDFAKAGQGLQADADRMQTELLLMDSQLAAAREDVAVASARLAYALSLDRQQQIVPLDATVVPLELVAVEADSGALVSSGLAARPELKEVQALVAAACDRYQREKYAPFVPSVLLGFSAGGFGGDTGAAISQVDDRVDFDAVVTWEVRNFGFGERAARRRTLAQTQQVQYRKIRLMDEVANQISEAHVQVRHRRERIHVTQQAIQTALDSYDRNLSRIRDGEGLPVEVLLSLKALESARMEYLKSVVDYNEAQFQLQWALGWPISAPAELR